MSMKEIGRRDHVRIWHADTAEPDRNPFKGSALGYQPRLYRGCEVEYLETILTTGVGWPLNKPYLWAAIDPGTAWEYPEESAHRIVMVVIKISDYVTARSDYGPPGRSWKHPDDPYRSLDHVVVAGDEHELLNRLQQIPGFEASARQRASTLDDPFLECLE